MVIHHFRSATSTVDAEVAVANATVEILAEEATAPAHRPSRSPRPTGPGGSAPAIAGQRRGERRFSRRSRRLPLAIAALCLDPLELSRRLQWQANQSAQLDERQSGHAIHASNTFNPLIILDGDCTGPRAVKSRFAQAGVRHRRGARGPRIHRVFDPRQQHVAGRRLRLQHGIHARDRRRRTRGVGGGSGVRGPLEVRHCPARVPRPQLSTYLRRGRLSLDPPVCRGESSGPEI